MTNLKINDRKKTIEISKAFAKKASYYGTEEYIALKNAKADNQNYRVITLAPKRTKPTFKGLTYDYMIEYIEKHDNEEKSIMAEFLSYTGKSDESKGLLADTMSYGSIKKWFLVKFPEFEAFHESRSKMYNNSVIKTKKSNITVIDNIAEEAKNKKTA